MPFDQSKLTEFKQSRAPRPSKQEHGTEWSVQDQFIHGCKDDAIQAKVSMDGDKCYSWGTVRVTNCEFGNSWRLASESQKHVDRFQALGNEKQTAATAIIFDGVRFTTRGDPLPPGATQADTCLIQEGRYRLELHDVAIDPSLQPIKVTLRDAKNECESILIDNCPNLRLHITARKAEQVGKIYVKANSPGVSIVGAEGLKLNIVHEDPMMAALSAQVVALRSDVAAANAKAAKAEAEAGRANERLGRIAEAVK